MPKQTVNEGRRWYAIHVYSGYEYHILRNLKQKINSMGMQNKIFNVLVPTEKKIKILNGKRKIIEEKIFPGYIIVDMIMDDDSWYIIRNTPNITGFVGSESVPISLTDSEIANLQKRMNIENPQYTVNFEVGSLIKIIDGPFKALTGKVSEVDQKRGKLKVVVSMFSRETTISLDVLQVKKAN